jgi:hypothetical protein
VPCPPQNQSILIGTPLRWRISALRMASDRVKSVSAVPWTSIVGTRIFSTSSSGPRESNHARSSAEILPEATPLVNAETMCGSRPPVCGPAGLSSPSPLAAGSPAAKSRLPQPALIVSSR